MNPLLSRLQPYPFARLRQLMADVTPSPAHRPISLGIGEPRHATPAQWPGLVRTYGPRAGLFGEDRARVTRWLQAAAR